MNNQDIRRLSTQVASQNAELEYLRNVNKTQTTRLGSLEHERDTLQTALNIANRELRAKQDQLQNTQKEVQDKERKFREELEKFTTNAMEQAKKSNLWRKQ